MSRNILVVNFLMAFLYFDFLWPFGANPIHVLFIKPLFESETFGC